MVCESHDKAFCMKSVSISSFKLLVNYFRVFPLPIEIHLCFFFQESLEEDVKTEFNILRESIGKRRDLMHIINLRFILNISPLVA